MNRAMQYQQGSLKISAMIAPDVTEEYLTVLEQLGVNYGYTWVEDDQCTVEFIRRHKERLAAHGITLYNVANLTLGKSADIHLALPGREERIHQYIAFLRTLSECDIHTTTITWEPNGTLSTSPVTGKVTYDPEATTRGGAKARTIDMDVMNRMPYSHGRSYSKQETWDNFTYFVQKVIPAAEEYQVRISLHPNDPPVDSVAGIATLIQNAEDYRRAFEIANSDFFGMEFCCGCWLEGGADFGNLTENFREFVEKNKVFIVHFRNVTCPLPKFNDTFLDDGYGDMKSIMKTILDTGYSGTITLDHTPVMNDLGGGDQCALAIATAYAVGYLKALVQALK